MILTLIKVQVELSLKYEESHASSPLGIVF